MLYTDKQEVGLLHAAEQWRRVYVYNLIEGVG